MSQITERTRRIYHVTLVGLVVNILLSVGKLLAGIVGRSGAMVADAVHSFSDLATDFIVLGFARLSAKPEDASYNYGYGKYETLAAVMISLFLLAIGGGILWKSIEGIRSVVHGEIIPRPGLIALIAAVASIAAKEMLYQYTARVGRQINSPSVVANAWHHRSDALSSIGTLLGIGLAYFLGEKWRIADPIAAAVVACFIFKIAFDLLRDGIGDLLERALSPELEQEILHIITATSPEVTDPHGLRTRRIGAVVAIEVHICVKPDMTVNRSHRLTVEIERKLRKRFGESSLITIHVEPEPDAA